MDTFRPKGGLLGGLAFGARQCVVLGVYPDAALEQVLLVPFRINFQDVGCAAANEFRSDDVKFIILREESRFGSHLRARCLRFRFQHFVQNVLVRCFPSVFRNDLEILCSVAAALYLHEHFGAFVEMLVLEDVSPHTCVSLN